MNRSLKKCNKDIFNREGNPLIAFLQERTEELTFVESHELNKLKKELITFYSR